MPTTCPIPGDATIAAMLGAALSVPVQVAKGQAPEPERESRGVFAEFVGDDDQLAAVAYADRDVVNFVGGAKAGLDIAAIQETSEQGVLSDEGVAGFRDVITAFASCFNTDFTKTVRSSNVTILPGQLTDEVKALWRAPRGRRAFRVTVDDFGSGLIVLYIG